MRASSLGIATITTVLALAGPAVAEPLVIIVSAEWQRAEAIQMRDLRAVYLGRRTRLFGERVRRIDLPHGSPARAGFSRSVLERPEEDLERYWIEQALSGGAIPPRQVGGPAEVVAAVRGRVGTFGYVAASDFARLDLQGVRMLPIVLYGAVREPGDIEYPARTLD